jgi:hypothetical protein
MRCAFVLVATLLLCVVGLFGQTFKGHTLGETAEQFFSTATKPAEYCMTHENKGVCKEVVAAIHGNDVQINYEYSKADKRNWGTETGKAGFHDGKLYYMQFHLDHCSAAGTVTFCDFGIRFNDVVTDHSCPN